jgi:sulfite exporter TauE/SafE/copper chaperone CopZ
VQRIEFRVEGTHCAACKARIEAEVGRLTGVKRISLDYTTGSCAVAFDDRLMQPDTIVAAIERLGYQVEECSEPETPREKRLAQRLIARGALLALLVAGYFLIQTSGGLELLSRLNEGTLGYGLIFAIGLLASLHCVGMCGGLVVTYTAGRQAANSRPNRSLVPHLQYNLGRVVSYTGVGAILGGFGSFVGVNPTFTGILALIAGVFMVLMGLSLLASRPWLRWNGGPLSKVAKFLYGQDGRGSKGPLIIGLINGFMPCGPLQAVQLYALSTGSIVRGALAMAVYALGTTPVMFGFGGAMSLLSTDRVKQALKVSGAVVCILGLVMLNRGLTNFGLAVGSRAAIPLPSEAGPVASPTAAPYQTARMELTYQGYVPNTLYVKKDVPVRWVIDVKQMTGCTDEIVMPDYNIRKALSYGENTIEFTPTSTGTVLFSCWMQMVWGKFIVM